jgi:hypothetical protein
MKFLFLFTIPFANYIKAQDVETQPYVKKSFCIILSTKSYSEAKKNSFTIFKTN